jgi:hypothetical protein
MAAVAQKSPITKTNGITADSLPPLTDSTKILSIQDVVEFDALLQQKFSVRELRTYQELFRFWQERIAVRVKEYEAKKKGGK